jgi:hypothetical protein
LTCPNSSVRKSTRSTSPGSSHGARQRAGILW